MKYLRIYYYRILMAVARACIRRARPLAAHDVRRAVYTCMVEHDATDGVRTDNIKTLKKAGYNIESRR